ncbi:helix-turn-helix domain-containing protein [Streptomyces sp. NPDC048641]|uniref:PucR family transcriptional regulator n=1 Tax=Streptomyces sp. NPDC048641 TaxID=3154825 RepID=UPI0034438874
MRKASSTKVDPCGPTLSELVERVGDDAWLVHRAQDERVQSIVLREPGRLEERIPPHAVLLAVGYRNGDPAFADFVARAGEARAAGVIAKPASIDAVEFGALGRLHDVTTVLARDSSDWLQLASLLKSAAALSATDSIAGARLGDLFTFANAVASMTGGATSIVDPTGRVLGFSNLPGQPIDQQRRDATLLMSEIDSPATDPDYRTVYARTGCLYVPGGTGVFGRVAAAVRSDGEILGTIWVIADAKDARAKATAVLPGLLDTAALHLHHARAELDLRRTRQANLLSALVRAPDESLAAALPFDISQRRWFVLAMLAPTSGDSASAPRDRLVRRLSAWLHIIHPSALLAEVDAHLVILFSGSAEHDWVQTERSLEDFFQGAHPNVASMTVIAGSRLGNVGDISAEFKQMQTLAGLLRAQVVTLRPGAYVVHLTHHHHHVDLAEMAGIRRNTDPRQPAVLRRIEELDKQSGTDYFRTLQVYVDNNRNIAATAAALGVHPNTARYRVEKIQATFNLDLADLDTFTWLVLHCRYLSRSTAGARPAN